jgi:hypothetical protein
MRVKRSAFTSLNDFISTFLMNFILKQKHLTDIFTRFENAVQMHRVQLKTEHRHTASLTALHFCLLCTLFTASWYLKRRLHRDTVSVCLSAIRIPEC